MDKVQITTDSSACKICKNCDHICKTYFDGWICCLNGNCVLITNIYEAACQHFTQKGADHE